MAIGRLAFSERRTTARSRSPTASLKTARDTWAEDATMSRMAW
ncbi:hypothetical protein [Solidesulfovibrio sp. C21]